MILVNARYAVDSNDVIAHDGQLAIAIVEQSAAKQPGIDLKVLAAQPTLDHNFPQTGGAEQKLILWIVDQSASFRGQSKPKTIPYCWPRERLRSC